MKLKHWRPELIILIGAALISRFINLFSPNAVFFDEIYFKQFAAHYFDGRYYFDIHPPLGKLLLALLAKAEHLSASNLLDTTAVGLRLLPALAGALLVPLVWAILRRLGANRLFACLGATAVLLDNALLVESRFILMDSMLLLFGLLGVYFYLLARDEPHRRWLWLTLAALSAGASLSIKWTGLGSLALIGLLWLWDQPQRQVTWGIRLAEPILLGLAPLVLYTSVFFVHFQLLPASGDGDAFMSERFQSTLVGNSNYDPHTHLSFLSKFVELNVEMFRANQTLSATHPYGSRWYTWPLELRPIYYWQGNTASNGDQGNIYLLGNPIVWWGIWVLILAGIAYAWITNHHLRPQTISALATAAAAYFINLIPFMAVARVMFLYHYFFSFLFSLMFAVLLWQDLTRDHLSSRQRQFTIGTIALCLLVAGFVFFAPITYGTPLSPAGLQARMWLPSWR